MSYLSLPYVNVGIILALAGIDYSKVKEPDYDPVKIQQKPEIDRWVDDIKRITLENWEKRNETKDRELIEKGFDDRSRNIFYDTDNLSETQKEKIRVCPDCSGTLQIDSSSDRGFHILAVHIPRKACSACQNLGHEWYDAAQKEDYDFAFLQDRVEDKYLQWKRE